jgi:hypothetical protein
LCGIKQHRRSKKTWNKNLHLKLFDNQVNKFYFTNKNEKELNFCKVGEQSNLLILR